MSAGKLSPPESVRFRDTVTGRTIRQITSHPSIHHHPFYYIPAFDDAAQRMIFVSHRTGRPEIFAELTHSGKLLQVTSHDTLAEWSLHPSHDGRHVYFTDGGGAWRVDLETMKEECIASFPGAQMREAGMVGAAMGTTTLSHDDRWWAVPVKRGARSHFYIIETATGKLTEILERDTIGHPEFHPDDNNLIRYAGPYQDRIWTIHRDGSDNRLVYKRNAALKEWIVHEMWIPGTRELLTVNWGQGLFAINADTSASRNLTKFKAWHPAISRNGLRIIADTTFPDLGIFLFDMLDLANSPRYICQSLSSNEGAHWKVEHCPYDDGPVKVYSPQHTHPHPQFTPDGSRFIFTSDRTGVAQLYDCSLRQ
jgi:oligogalacturonide lyase